jgi:hypothetical protein
MTTLRAATARYADTVRRATLAWSVLDPASVRAVVALKRPQGTLLGGTPPAASVRRGIGA